MRWTRRARPACFTAAAHWRSIALAASAQCFEPLTNGWSPATGPKRPPTMELVHMRRVNPDDAGDSCTSIAIAVREMGLEEERVTSGHMIRCAVDHEVNLTFEKIANRLALVGDRIVLLAAW